MSDCNQRVPVEQAPQGTTSFHQVLILIAAYFFGTSGGTESLGEAVRDAVEDEQRSEVAGELADAYEAEVELRVQGLLKARASFYETAARYDASAADLDAALGSSVAETERLEVRLLDLRFELRDTLTADEWQELCDGLEFFEE